MEFRGFTQLQLAPPGEPGRQDLPVVTSQTPGVAAPRLEWADRSEQASDESGPDSLPGYWRILQRNKAGLLLAAIAGGLAGLLLTLPQTPVYQARTSLEIQSLNQDFMDTRNVNPNAESNNYSPENDIQTQVTILESRALIDGVIRRLDLEHNPLLTPRPAAPAWRRVLHLAPKDAGMHEWIANWLAGNLKVRSRPNTRIIEITFDSADSRLAADIASTLTSEFIDQNLESRWRAMQRTGDFLTRQLEDLRLKIQKSEGQLQAYARSTGLVFTQEQNNIAEDKLKQLQTELSQAQADRILKQSKYELAANTPPETLAEVLDDGTLKETRSKLNDLRRQLAELLPTFTQAHPSVKKVQAQIQSVQAALDRERSDILGRIKNDYRAALRRENLLEADYTAYTRQISRQAGDVTHYQILKRELDTNRELYSNMMQRVREAGIASALRTSNVRIIDPAAPPASPYKPKPALNAGIGVLSGLFLACTLVIWRERSDRTLQDPGHAVRYLRLPELGVIPGGSPASGRKWRRRERDSGSAPYTTLFPAAATASKTSGRHLELITWSEKQSLLAESFRSVLTSILFTGATRPDRHVIVLASANPKEGKTTVSSNLAIAIAELNRPVLLIDGDMRRPRLDAFFDVSNAPGFSELLSDTTALDSERLKAAVRKTHIPNLSLLPAGSFNPLTNVIYSPRLAELLGLARRMFDMVIVDSPPVLHFCDARVIARYADAVVFVLRAHKSTRDAAELAIRRFAQDGVPVLGTVLNDWDPHSSGADGYGGYARQYSQYYGHK